MPSYKQIHVIVVVENVRNAYPKIIAMESYLNEKKAIARRDELYEQYKKTKNTAVIMKCVPLNDSAN